MTNTTRLSIFQINDVHGYLTPHPEIIWGSSGPEFVELGGYARIAAFLAQVRTESAGAVLTLDNGDTFHGTFEAVHSQGRALVPVLNALHLDAMTAHWDFAWGPEHFSALAGMLNYPMLAINCYREADGTRPFPASAVIHRAGLRIGVVGIAATILDNSMPDSFSKGLRFTLGRDELPGEIARLKDAEAADLIVVLSHLGLPQDYKLASEVDGIDVLVSGHTHNRLEQPLECNGSLMIQSGCHGSFVGRLDLEIERDRVTNWSHSLVPMDGNIASNRDMSALIEGIVSPHQERLCRIVGHTSVPLHRYGILESSMDDLLLEAIAVAAGTAIAFSNGWRYGAPIADGPITLRDLWNIIPTNPPVSIVTLKGSEIRTMIEENMELTLAADPYRQRGGYLKRCRGLTVYFKIENPPGHRVERLFCGGDLLLDEQAYDVAFVTEQGVPKKFGTGRRDLEVVAVEALEYLLNTKTWEGSRSAPTFLPI